MSYSQLTSEQRYYISQLIGKQSISQIAKDIGCHKSTVSREIRRNSINQNYHFKQARQLYQSRRCRQQPTKLTPERIRYIDELIKQKLSPEQVCAYLGKHHRIRLHHSTLYRHIHRDTQNGGTLFTHLRICSKPYRKKYAGKNWSKGKVPNRVGIEERPAIVDSKERIGDWEVDTIVGKDQKSALVVATERKTKLTRIRKIENFKAENTAQMVIAMLRKYKKWVHTITMDNGKEFYRHTLIAKALNAATYFCRPYHSWEKGLVENTNGLIRQYFPKGTDFRVITDDEIRAVETALNRRPRKSLNYETPESLFFGRFTPLISGVALDMRM